MRHYAALLLLPITLALSACLTLNGDEHPVPEPLSTEATATPIENLSTNEIVLSISLYVLVDDLDMPNEDYSSQRSEDGLTETLEGVNEIWSQAGIRFEPQIVTTIPIPEDILGSALVGDFAPFLASVDARFDVPQAALINGFYVREIGGPNGINPFRSRIFFVTDTPSVLDHRVTAHEIGHILGLHHVLTDRNHLMSPGVNGMQLDAEEIGVARYVAQGMLDRVR